MGKITSKDKMNRLSKASSSMYDDESDHDNLVIAPTSTKKAVKKVAPKSGEHDKISKKKLTSLKSLSVAEAFEKQHLKTFSEQSPIFLRSYTELRTEVAIIVLSALYDEALSNNFKIPDLSLKMLSFKTGIATQTVKRCLLRLEMYGFIGLKQKESDFNSKLKWYEVEFTSLFKTGLRQI